MNLKQNIYILIFAFIIGLSSCADNPEVAGREYMPDMAHSIAYEANVLTEYSYNTWDAESVKSLRELSHPGEPVKGTIARGYAGVYYAKSAESRHATMMNLQGQDSPNSVAVPLNGSVPYPYANTDDGRAKATAELLNNPFPITTKGLEEGKELYDIYCGICHGKKMDGNGYLTRDDSPYQAGPKSFIIDEYIDASNGRLYHAIEFGINVMGSYKDKMSYEERWNVIHYIRSIQAKVRKAEYSEELNTLNNSAIPGASVKPIAKKMDHSDDHDNDHGDGHGEENHEEDYHDDGDHDHDGGHH